jgi:hypothetical protein
MWTTRNLFQLMHLLKLHVGIPQMWFQQRDCRPMLAGLVRTGRYRLKEPFSRDVFVENFCLGLVNLTGADMNYCITSSWLARSYAISPARHITKLRVAEPLETIEHKQALVLRSAVLHACVDANCQCDHQKMSTRGVVIGETEPDLRNGNVRVSVPWFLPHDRTSDPGLRE